MMTTGTTTTTSQTAPRTTLMRRVWVMVAALALAGTAAVPSVARADRQDELQERFKDRLPDIRDAKADGKIGETTEGVLEAVNGQDLDDDLRKLVDEENADRRELYKLIAEKEKTTADKVAERNANRNFQKARSGEYLKTREGEWKKKK
jgi:uncharacterized protein YdbL (DUF1318 family)